MKVLLRRSQVAMLLTVGVFGAVSIFFQNCAESPRQQAFLATPSTSPFFEQRVRIDEVVEPQSRGLAKVAEPQTLTVLVNNACATELCAQTPNSLVCRLQKAGLRDELSDTLQAYRYVPETEMSAQELQDEISFSTADQSCLIGISNERTYSSQAFTDPLAGAQYFHQVLGSEAAMPYFSALPQVETNTDFGVGIIDSGVDENHEDLKATLITNRNFSESCTAVCNYHGTAVASVIAAAVNNGKGGVGLYNGRLKIYSAQTGDDSGRIRTTELINALSYMASVNVEVINMSLGGFATSDFAMQDLFERLAEKDISIVVSAGNNGQDLDARPYYPASFRISGQITVGAASPSGVPTGGTSPATAAQIATPIVLDSFSNYSPTVVDIAAPGRGIVAAALNNGYTTTSGTSFSAPMVTAAVMWVRQYAKATGLKLSARQVKEIVLQSAAIAPGLKDKVNGQRYLSFAGLKLAVEGLAASAGSERPQIQLVASEVVGTAPNQRVRVTVAISGANAANGWTMRVYTDKNFLNQTNTGQTCNIVMDTTCTVEVSYASMLVDPGLYFEIKGPNGLLITDLTVLKANLNFGNRATAPILGRVINTSFRGKKVLVEGWACLKGFPDQLKVEVRVSSNTGAAYQTIEATQFARGEYFNSCESAEVRVGFLYAVPESVISSSAAGRKLYFRAVLRDGSRSFDLPVVTYQPLYQDTNPEQTTDSVFLDPYLNDQTPTVQLTKVNYKDFVLTLEGRACFPSAKKPAVLALGISYEDILDLLPETRMVLNRAQTGSTNAADGEIATKTGRARYVNSSARTVDNAGTYGVYSDWFNTNTREIHFLAPNFSDRSLLVRSEATIGGGALLATIVPTTDSGNGCAFKDGFSTSFDVRKALRAFGASAYLSYRADKIADIDAVLRSNGASMAQVALLNSGASGLGKTFSDLVWSPRAMPLNLRVLGQADQIIELGQTVNGVMQYLEDNSGVQGWNTGASPVAYGYSDLAANALGVGTSTKTGEANQTMENFATMGHHNNTGIGIPAHRQYWIESNSFNVKSTAATPTLVKSIGPLTLARPAISRLIVGMQLEQVVPNVLSSDLILEFRVNGTGSWMRAPIARYDDRQFLVADVDLSATVNTLELRFSVKGTEQFVVKRMIVGAE